MLYSCHSVSLYACTLSSRQTLKLGATDFTPDDVKNIVDQLGKDFRGDQYHLLNKNCNHFTTELTKVGTMMENISSSMIYI